MKIFRSKRAWQRWLLVLASCLILCCQVRADTIPFQEKTWEQLSNHDLDPDGALALSIRPQAWLHGETPGWIIHYRRITEAKRVALEIDFHLAFVTKTLGASAEQVAHKAHVYIFEDEKDWHEFMAKMTTISRISPWAASFAHGQDLFLNVRDGRTGIFDSQTLAHETTHAVVARIYPHQRPPLWLSEGFAEEMSGRSTAARMGQYNQRLLMRSALPAMPLEQLLALEEYPPDLATVAQLYQSAEKLVRYLMTNLPADHFPALFAALVNGEELSTALPRLYPQQVPTFGAFVQRYKQTVR